MMKKFLPLLAAPLLLAGCNATFTNLTPHQQTRSTNNLYRVEVALASRQQSLRWDSIQPKIVVGTDSYPMRVTPLMTNRFEGLVPVPATSSLIRYHYKFDFNYNAMGGPQPDSAVSPEYTLKVLEQ
jgi:hypothetical protein